ncbi:arsenate reductase [Sulfuriferula plumbiphila]|uniref:Arsenate reductase n=1 Tax=Sulfuriferula plumbiphila TaxID=171865 RepID=A0A512LB70_9PROT|nr:arsenate reductase [Sulfuriferula plumbiphila]BBP04349.1 arsenate reductase [Sulfuriferula plumbiphila]GEP31733.1 arsenate reductase [Sulfuriferula plumbiphila]
MRIYGISNCTTVKKALAWLDEHGQAYEFHDFKKTGVNVALLTPWAQQVGWEKLLNRQGMTWRQLPDTVKAGVTSQEAAFALMMEKTSVIKRPVLEHAGRILVGFSPADYAALTGD